MAIYVAFLRAINLGPRRKFPKGEIVAATEGAGFGQVETHINTGNVRLDTRMRSRVRIEAALERAYDERAGFAVPTIVFAAGELRAIAEDAAELGGTLPGLTRHYVNLLKSDPDPARVAALEERSTDEDRVVVRGRAAHVLHGPAYQPGKVDPFNIEKALGVVATNRNATVVTTVARKWC